MKPCFVLFLEEGTYTVGCDLGGCVFIYNCLQFGYERFLGGGGVERHSFGGDIPCLFPPVGTPAYMFDGVVKDFTYMFDTGQGFQTRSFIHV